MDSSKIMIFSLGVFTLVGACVPYPPEGYQGVIQPQVKPDNQQTLTDEEQRQIDESRARLKRQQEARERRNEEQDSMVSKPAKPNKPNYPTASAVPGKPGFVFNPYTHNIVDVKGIGSGKLVKDPEDSDATHKFRVP